ncbi:mandelate racemase/muconate lactonizing enzyme family protein [Jiangella muralis]|uniref:mandelate racemase/muconate lactonizing enzyme family protein n=1 Tax=Jiangella muralis TaxID=702383 RepID=UPI00069D88B5|nr:mandelate racemase/muconate lactonizing enzyme family protein [Jiangella muralis]
MKITELRVHVVDVYRTNLVLVELQVDDGSVGVGEATLEYKEQAVVGALNDIRDAVVGSDARNVTRLLEELYRGSYWRTGPVLNSALSAIEMCLMDLNARSLDVPVHRLLGGTVRDGVQAYANGWFAGARTPDDFARAAVATVARGFQGLKLDPFGSAYLTIDHAALDRAVSVLGAVRDAVGPSIDVLVEAHGRFSPTTAVAIAREIAPLHIFWFEEPCPPENVDALLEVRRRSEVPIAAGERIFDRHAFSEILRRGAVDYIQPDVSHVGGLSEVRRIADLAAMHYVAIAPHNPSGPVATAATMHLAAALPNFRYLEIMATDVPWRRTLTDEELVFDGGQMLIPTRPGLGVTLRPDAFGAHPYVPHPLRHYDDTLTDIRPVDAVRYF